MSQSNYRNRQPPGTEAGGEYAVEERTESEGVSLGPGDAVEQASMMEFQQLYHNDDIEGLVDLCYRHPLPKTVATELARHPDSTVRQTIAGKGSIWGHWEVALDLAKDPDPAVRQNLAQNIHLTMAVSSDGDAAMVGLELAGDEDTEVVCTLASSKMPPVVWEKVLEHPDAQVRQAVAESPDTRAVFLYQLARDPHGPVRAAALLNPSAPRDIISSFMQERDTDVIAALLERIRTESIGGLHSLANHPSPEVSGAARARLERYRPSGAHSRAIAAIWERIHEEESMERSRSLEAAAGHDLPRPRRHPRGVPVNRHPVEIPVDEQISRGDPPPDTDTERPSWWARIFRS